MSNPINELVPWNPNYKQLLAQKQRAQQQQQKSQQQSTVTTQNYRNNKYDSYLAEAYICDKNQNCDTYYIQLLKPSNNKAVPMATMPTTMPTTIPTVPVPSTFQLIYQNNVTGNFYFGGNSDANFQNDNSQLTVSTSNKYFVSVTFPTSSTPPTFTYLDTTLAFFIVNTTKYRMYWSIGPL